MSYPGLYAPSATITGHMYSFLSLFRCSPVLSRQRQLRMTVALEVIDRAIPEGVSGGLVGRAGRGVCGSHQLKDDRCGGREGGTVVGWLLCTADRRRTTVGCIQRPQVLI